MLKDKIDKLLRQPMTRKEFLRNSGLFLVSLIGLSSAINVFFSNEVLKTNKPDIWQSRRSFGNGRYGP